MTAALAPVLRGAYLPPPWLANADPRDGIRVRVDGATTLHTGSLAEPSYRADVLSQDCAVELCCDDALLRFQCLPADDGADPPEPGRPLGWTVEGFDSELCAHRLPARLAHVLCACAGDREAIGAVEEITRWVARECSLRADTLRARAAVAPRGAPRWRSGGARRSGSTTRSSPRGGCGASRRGRCATSSCASARAQS